MLYVIFTIVVSCIRDQVQEGLWNNDSFYTNLKCVYTTGQKKSAYTRVQSKGGVVLMAGLMDRSKQWLIGVLRLVFDVQGGK